MIPDKPNYTEAWSDWYGEVVSKMRANCDVCEDHSGVVYEGEHAKECQCTILAKKYLLLKRGNVPKEYWARPKFDIRETLPDFPNMVETVKAGRGIYLTGANGTGKTTTAIELLRVYLSELRSVFRIEANELVRALVLATRGRRWTDLWIQDGMFKDCVAIDEMGAEFAKSFFGQESRVNLGYFVKHRAEQGMPTILCTNLSAVEFEDVYGSTVASVVEGHRFETFNLTGEDWRARLGD